MTSLIEAYKNEVLNGKQKNKTHLTKRRSKEDYYEGEVRITYKKTRIYPKRPLNKWFPQSHLHHLHRDLAGNVDHGVCAYIPRDMHQDHPHNSVTWEGMDEINELTYKFLDEQKAAKRTFNTIITERLSKPAPKLATKKCAHCGRELTSDHFYLDNHASHKLTCWCKECQKERLAKTYLKKKVAKLSAEVEKNNIEIQKLNETTNLLCRAVAGLLRDSADQMLRSLGY
jgi:hypothetical protein